MIKKIYTLQEAFEIGLLEEYENVDLKPLYMPYRKKLVKEYEAYKEYSTFSLAYVRKFLNGNIYNRDGIIFVMCELDLSRYEKMRIEVAPELLSNEMYGIRATYKATYENKRSTYRIEIGPDINVEFVGDAEIPTLRLPEHTAYTC